MSTWYLLFVVFLSILDFLFKFYVICFLFDFSPHFLTPQHSYIFPGFVHCPLCKKYKNICIFKFLSFYFAFHDNFLGLRFFLLIDFRGFYFCYTWTVPCFHTPTIIYFIPLNIYKYGFDRVISTVIPFSMYV